MWRFKLCLTADGNSCGTSDWSGGRLFEANSSSGNRPVYTTAAVAKDTAGHLWVYWGTGDKTDPTSPSAQEKFIALKDDDRTTTRTISDMQNITSEGGEYNDNTKYGYYMNLAGQGEKMLAEPTVFGGLVYFTTFTPAQGNDPCEQGGTAKLYGISYKTGAGALPATDTPRSMTIGQGIPSAPVISLKTVRQHNTRSLRDDQRWRGNRCPDTAGEHQSPRLGEQDQYALLERQKIRIG